MTITIENQNLLVSINDKGAELSKIFNKRTNLDYLWNADPAYWAKTSPILFPIVGTLKNDTYLYKGQSYKLSRHGFARDMNFEVKEQKDIQATFRLSSSSITKEKFPFDFILDVSYKIADDRLTTTYTVTNSGEEEMFFSLGAHPAFKIPLSNNTKFDDYFLQFEQLENAMRWPIDPKGLITTDPVSLLNKSDHLPLTHELFYEDALVLKDVRSRRVSLKSDKASNGLTFYYEGFPYLGIWSAKNANFVCIEPWCGVADSVAHDQSLITKEGIIKLDSGASWSRSWRVELY